jgi:GNAT superfamily N-acetyltransferase
VRRFGGIGSLAADHDLEAFDCGPDAQTVWLRQHARQAHAAGGARVYVVCRSESRAVVGYYALAAGSVEHETAPPRITKGLGRYPIPVVILTRLGVDLSEQGRGLGSALLRDAFLQVAMIADKVGVRALLIHAETPAAAAFYQRLDDGFETSPTDPLHLLLLIKDLRRAIRDAAGDRQASDS